MSQVIVCSWSGGSETLARGLEESLTLGRRLAGSLDAELALLVLGPVPRDAAEVGGRHGVATLLRAADPTLTADAPDALVEALSQICVARRPRALLVPQNFDARVVAPRLAGRLGAPIVMNTVDACIEAGSLRITAHAYGGDTHAILEIATEGTTILGVSTTAVRAEPAPAATSPKIEDVSVSLEGVRERIRVVERAQAKGPRLEDAEIIVSGGRGLGAAEHFALIEELAGALGGMAGASRPLIDDGWVDASRQVGLTGRITRPALYVAVGISGASQHMAGCSAAKTIVAINSDRDAAIFRHARYGIVGDCREILPALIRAARARR
jgi:electron transfer flavoprotein alpha subunit